MEGLTHFNKEGRAKMVDVGDKKETKREAVASGKIFMKKETLDNIVNQTISKGDVLSVAQVAGIQGAKETSRLIPMCHNIFLTGVDIAFDIDHHENSITVEATAETVGKTGVEMEALTAVSVTLLTIYDMCKAIDKDMVVENIKLIKKTGGKSGPYLRKE